MKTKAIYFSLALIAFGCTRDEEVLPAARFPTTADIFTDVPVSLTDEFFISFDPAEGANPNGFGVDEIEAFEGTTSIRIDVPAADDPDGGFIGGIFLDRNDGRDLTEYNALTFWARASVTVPIGRIGFGSDFEEDIFPASVDDLQLNTKWTKYTVPIPDPSKLTQEKGMFLFSAGTQATNGVGYTFWIDELRFENTSSVAQPLAQIANGLDETIASFNGVTIPVTGTNVIYNVDGTDVSVSAAPAYYNFTSSDPAVASVDEEGNITVNQIGTAVITATIGEGSSETSAQGSITVTSTGEFDFAPTPTREASTVISLFSDAYDDIPVSRYNSFFEPFQTTLGGVVPIGSQSIISYTELNFVGIVFNDVIFPAEAVPTVDATDFTHLHIDFNVREEVQTGDLIQIELTDYGDFTTTGVVTIRSDDLQSESWVGFDIPLGDFAGLADRSNLGLLLFNSQSTISDIYLDNIYFYQE